MEVGNETVWDTNRLWFAALKLLVIICNWLASKCTTWAVLNASLAIAQVLKAKGPENPLVPTTQGVGALVVGELVHS